MTLRLLQLVGSPTDDFFCDLARLWGTGSITATRAAGYPDHIAYVTPDRQWRFPTSLAPDAIAAAEPMGLDRAIAHIEALDVDLMVPYMYCLPGMTTYRALFDLLAIPYFGSSPTLMANTAHKGRARAIVAAAGVAVPEGEVVRRGQRPRLTPPVVVKPAAADNSSGVALVRTADALDDALAAAFEHGPEVLVERFVPPGREVRCGVVERGGRLVCLPLEEYPIDAEQSPIRTYDDKYARNRDGALYAVAKDADKAWIVDPDDPVTERVWQAARRCHRALGCRQYGLFDFRVDPDGQPWFLEAGLYCSFAPKGVIWTMARAADLPLDALMGELLRGALGRSAM